MEKTKSHPSNTMYDEAIGEPDCQISNSASSDRKECHDIPSPHYKNVKTEKMPPDPDRCHFFLRKKHRYCKNYPLKGRNCCAEHLIEVDGSRKRIPCPLDPRHNCYADQLPKHLKKCNARESARPVYFVQKLNSGNHEDEDPDKYKVGIRDLGDSDLLTFVKKIQALHKEYVGELALERLFHKAMQDAADKPDNGAQAQKHIQQQASLIGHMDRSGLLRSSVSYIEFGAGKGGLSHWVQLANSAAEDTQWILVEKGSVRYKMDSFHKGTHQGPSFERIQIDIENLCLGLVPNLKEKNLPVVGIGKHLCGGATDLMLRCLNETLNMNSDAQHKKKHVAGLTLALCCHHRCDWMTYVGKQFFYNCGLTARDFHIMCSLTSWATCAATAAGEYGDDGTYKHPRYGSLRPEQREQIGRQSKQLIDHGRVHYLQQHGYSVQHLCYIEKTFSLENMAIIAIGPECPVVL